MRGERFGAADRRQPPHNVHVGLYKARYGLQGATATSHPPRKSQ